MFERNSGSQPSPSFNKGVGKSVTDRMNMGRLYVFNLCACAIMLVITALMRLCNFYILSEGYQTTGFLLFAACLGLSAAAVFITSRTNSTELFANVCYCWLGMISAVLYCFAFRSSSNAASLIFVWALMLVIGFIPILRRRELLIIWGIDMIPALILAFVRHYTADSIITLVCVSGMGLVLCSVTYSNTIRRLNYKLSLDFALSQAETDPMTQLLNRRGLDRRLDTVWPHCIRQNSCVAVIMLDIDNFKKYNDSFGHPAGDECIKKVTGAMRKAIKRRTDYGARVGGEEFLIFLTGIEPKLAVKWALELKKAIDELKIPQAESNFRPYVSVSMGLACAVARDGLTFEELKSEADKSLYEAKENGRACLYFRHQQFGGRQSVLKKQAQAAAAGDTGKAAGNQ